MAQLERLFSHGVRGSRSRNSWLQNGVDLPAARAGERTGVDVADGIDETDDATGAAEIQSRERLAQRRQVEERVAGQDVRVFEQ